MMEVLNGVKEISEHFGLTRKTTTKYLNTKGFPLLPREKGGTYRVIASEMETWLRTRKVGQ